MPTHKAHRQTFLTKDVTPELLRAIIAEKLPEGTVVTAHDKTGHWYSVPHLGETFPSVTGKLQILKDPSLKHYAVNENNKYIFAHFKEFTDSNIMDQLDIASRKAEDNRDSAGDFGTEIHDIRECYFKDWIRDNKRPEKRLEDYIPFEMSSDPRAISCIRALKRFLLETLYVPVRCELLLYDAKLEIGGTLDDVGLMHTIKRKGSDICDHDYIVGIKAINCWKCPHKLSLNPIYVLLDLKTSNQFKDHYWYQVTIYLWCLINLTGITPKKSFILKTGKLDGMYKLEEIKQHKKIMAYAKNFLRAVEGLDLIRELRKDNQKKVGRPMLFNKVTV